MNQNITIKKCSVSNVERYGEIYAEAFSGEPWYDNWSVSDATVHVNELLENKHSYGLECIVNGEIAGFILGTSMLFHFGRMFDINDLAVATKFQRQGIATSLLQQMICDVKKMGCKSVNLITASEGILPEFYARFGFKKESQVSLMGLEL